MNRNIAKPFVATLSLLDVATDKTHKYKCFHGEDVQLTVNVVGEEKRRVDLSNTRVKIYFALDKNVNEPIYRQDTGIVVDNLGVITVMLEKSYIRIGNNVLKIVLYDEDQTVFLQPLIISCIDPLIGEVADLEIPDDIDVRDELSDIRRIIGDLQDVDDDLGREIIEVRNEYETVWERLDNFDWQLDNIEIKKATKQEVDDIAREVVDARKTYGTVGGRLDTIETEKATKVEVDVERKRIDSFTKLGAGSTTGDAELIDGRVGANGTTYTNIGDNIRDIAKGNGLIDKGIPLNKLSVSVNGKNLFDYKKVTVDRYLVNGSLIFYANYNVSDYIYVREGDYTLNNLQFGSVEFFTTDKVFKEVISSTTDKKGVVTFSITENGYIRFTVLDSDLYTTQLEKGKVSTAFEEYMYKIPSKFIEGFLDNTQNKTVITVEKSGGMFDSITKALDSITDASENNRYEIRVGLGTFEETFRTKNYVDIIGKDKYKTIISYTGNVATWVDTSTVFAESECKIANMTIEGTDTKYAMHIDRATGQWTCILENVRMIHRGSLTDETKAGTPIGIGLYPYQYLILKNCEMIYEDVKGIQAYGASGVYFHNQSDSVGTGYRSIRIEECAISGVTYGIRPNDVMGQSTKQHNDAYIINNNIKATHQEYYYPENSQSWNIFKKGNEYTQG